MDVSVEHFGGYKEELEKDKGVDAQAQLVISFQCEPTKLSAFVTAVVDKLREGIVASSGKADETVPKDHDWSNSPFTLNYSHGDAKGVARITIGKTTSTEYPHELRVTVREAVAN